MTKFGKVKSWVRRVFGFWLQKSKSIIVLPNFRLFVNAKENGRQSCPFAFSPWCNLKSLLQESGAEIERLSYHEKHTLSALWSSALPGMVSLPDENFLWMVLRRRSSGRTSTERGSWSALEIMLSILMNK